MNAFKSMGEAGNVASAKLQAAYAKVGEASKRFEVVQAQAALAMKKAQDAAHDDSLSLEQVQVATTKADLAAERVTSAQASVAAAMERAANVARTLATAETQVAEKADMAGLSMRERLGQALSSVSEAGQGFIGRIAGMGSGLLNFGSQLGMTFFSLQQLGQTVQWLGQVFIGQDASMEQTTVGFTQLLGSVQAAHAEMKDLQQFAAATPFEFPELADATQKLIAFQFPLKETKPLLTAIGDALSGLGANTPATLEQVVHVFGQMHSTTHLMTGDLMQLTSVGINGFQILADQMHKPVSVIREMVTKGLIPANDGIEMLRKGMEKTFGGGMQAQSITFNGLLSTFQDNIGAAWRAFTGPLFEKAKGGLTELGNLVSSKSFQDFATTLGGNVANALNTVGRVFGEVVTAFKSPEFAQLATTLSTVFAPALQKAGDVINSVFKPALDAVSGAKIADISTALRQAAIAVNIYLEALQGFKDGSSWFEQAGTSVRDTALQVQDVMRQVGDYLTSTFTPVWQQLQDTINSQVIPAWNDLVNSLTPLMPTLTVLAEAIGVVVVAALWLFTKVLAQVYIAVIRTFGGIVQIISGAVQMIAGSIAFMVDLFNGDFGKLGDDLLAQWNGIIDIFRGALNILNAITGGALDAMLHLFGTSIDQINAKATDMNKSTSKSASDMSKNVQGSFSSMSSGSLSSVQTLSDKAQQILDNLKTNGIGDFQQLDQYAIQYWNDVAGYINDHPINFNGNAFSGTELNLYNKNKGYASGTSYAPGGNALVAEAGAELVLGPRVGYLPPGSQVISHAQTMSLLGGGLGGGNNQPIHIHVEVGGHEVLSYLIDHMGNAMMQQSILQYGRRAW